MIDVEELKNYIKQKAYQYEEEAYRCMSNTRAVKMMAKSKAYNEIINKIEEIEKYG